MTEPVKLSGVFRPNECEFCTNKAAQTIWDEDGNSFPVCGDCINVIIRYDARLKLTPIQ